MTPCELIGHKYRPRYSISNDAMQKLVDSAAELTLRPSAIIAMQEKKYECDVCERCGKVANAPKGNLG